MKVEVSYYMQNVLGIAKKTIITKNTHILQFKFHNLSILANHKG